MKILLNSILFCSLLIVISCNQNQRPVEIKTSGTDKKMQIRDSITSEIDQIGNELDENGKKVDEALEKLKEKFPE